MNFPSNLTKSGSQIYESDSNGRRREALEPVNDSLSFGASKLAAEEAEELAFCYYGIRGRAFRLTSERDQNFCVRSEDGREYALRISHPAEDPSVSQFQVASLEHIARVAPDLPLPRLIRSLDDRDHLALPFAEDGVRAVRLLSYLQGVPLHTVERTSVQRKALGGISARLGRALRGFFHPAAGHDLAWDIKNAARVRGLLEHIKDPARRGLAEHFLDGFEVNALPRLAALRAQIVHNDLSAFNVLVDPDDHDQIAGVVDFGDMVHTALANDVAVGASYHFATPSPWQAALEFIVAYHDSAPLEAEELMLLYDLIAARFVVTVSITGWRALRHPENSEYILKNNAGAWAGLEVLFDLPRSRAQEQLLAVCRRSG